MTTMLEVRECVLLSSSNDRDFCSSLLQKPTRRADGGKTPGHGGGGLGHGPQKRNLLEDIYHHFTWGWAYCHKLACLRSARQSTGGTCDTEQRCRKRARSRELAFTLCDISAFMVHAHVREANRAFVCGVFEYDKCSIKMIICHGRRHNCCGQRDQFPK